MTFDHDFAGAVHAAAAGNKKALADWIASDKPLGAGERRMLAQYVRGEFDRPAGRPSRSKVPEKVLMAAAVEYLNRTDAGEKGEAITHEFCGERGKPGRLGISRARWLDYLRQARASIARLEAMGLDGRAIFSPEK